MYGRAVYSDGQFTILLSDRLVHGVQVCPFVETVELEKRLFKFSTLLNWQSVHIVFVYLFCVYSNQARATVMIQPLAMLHLT